MQALPPPIVAGEIVRLQTRQHVVALTFDGGGNADGATDVLSLLRRKHVRATFFLTGHFVQSYPALARAIGRRYPVGNHTVNHLDMLRLPPAVGRREVTRAALMIQRATGRDTHPYFRFPLRLAQRGQAAHAQRPRLCIRALDGRHLGLDGSLAADGSRRRATSAGQAPARRDRAHASRVVARREHHRFERVTRGIHRVRARGYRFVTLAGVRAP